MPKPNDNSAIGMGLSGPAYWTTEWLFVDLMRLSSAWVSNNEVRRVMHQSITCMLMHIDDAH